jgi:hypothetical protein
MSIAENKLLCETKSIERRIKYGDWFFGLSWISVALRQWITITCKKRENRDYSQSRPRRKAAIKDVRIYLSVNSSIEII